MIVVKGALEIDMVLSPKYTYFEFQRPVLEWYSMMLLLYKFLSSSSCQFSGCSPNGLLWLQHSSCVWHGLPGNGIQQGNIIVNVDDVLNHCRDDHYTNSELTNCPVVLQSNNHHPGHWDPPFEASTSACWSSPPPSSPPPPYLLAPVLTRCSKVLPRSTLSGPACSFWSKPTEPGCQPSSMSSLLTFQDKAYQILEHMLCLPNWMEFWPLRRPSKQGKCIDLNFWEKGITIKPSCPGDHQHRSVWWFAAQRSHFDHLMLLMAS